MPFIPSAALLQDSDVELPWLNVRDYGAVGNGVSDDRQMIQDAINACGAAGGGTVLFPDGDYLLSTTGTTIGALYIAHDNVTLEWAANAKWINTNVSQGPLAILGSAKGGYQASWWTHQMAITTNIAIAAHSAGDSSLTILSSSDLSALGLVAGDYILIRTGAPTGVDHKTPDSEINQVVSASGTTINLRWPLLKSYAQEYFPTASSPTTLAADALPGATSITVASATGFTDGAWITIGSPGGPMQADAINGSPSGNVIQLTGVIAPGITIPSGAIVNRGSGISTTGATGAPCVMGVAKVTDRILHNIRLVNPRWESLAGVGATQLDGVELFRVEGGNIYTAGGGLIGNNIRNGFYTNLRIHHDAANNGDYSIAFGTGTGCIRISSPIITTENTGGIAASEGAVDVGITDPSILHTLVGLNSAQAITFQTRSGGRIIGGYVRGSGDQYAIGVDPGCRGGTIVGLDVDTTAVYSILVQSEGWIVRDCLTASPDDIGITVAGSLGHGMGAGSPLNVVNQPPGSTFHRTDGGASTSFYVKESGVNVSTGWVAK